MTPRILITNDDGIHAPGIALLEKIARELSDDIWIVAPEFEQSGTSHALSLTQPIRIREVAPRKFALQGTPTDCVILACTHIMREAPPTLVLSGINRGANLAEDMTYSGTVAGAMEGALRGIRAISMSQIFTGGEPVKWHTAETHGARVLRQLVVLDLPVGVFLNINFPDREPDEVAGVAATHQGTRDEFKVLVNDRVDARGFPYIWLSFKHTVTDPAEETDLYAVRRGMISVTPLHCDLTHRATHAQLKSALRSS
jgi:5'-nucleotidase